MPRKKTDKVTTKAVQAVEDEPFVAPDVEVKPDTADDEAPFELDGLKLRQRLFVEAYVGPAGGNASKAAAMAGYASENRNALYVTASRLLSSAKIQEAIAHSFTGCKGSPEWTKASLIDLASASMANFLSRNDSGEYELDMDRAAAAGALGQIKELREEVIKTAGSSVLVRRTLKIHDRVHALSLLAKMQGLVVDQTTVTITTPQQQALGRILRDPKSFALARQLSERMSKPDVDGSDN